MNRVTLCDTPLSRLLGLMFRRRIDEDEALLFDFEGEGRMARGRGTLFGNAIHMLFVFFPIACIWLDENFEVVDKVIAKPFRPFYAPKRQAHYLLECHPRVFSEVAVGERLSLARATETKSHRPVQGEGDVILFLVRQSWLPKAWRWQLLKRHVRRTLAILREEEAFSASLLSSLSPNQGRDRISGTAVLGKGENGAIGLVGEGSN